MSGFGERFRRAGYAVPKPLIQIEGKPLIAHVVDMFPGEANFIFICAQSHLDEPAYGMEEILQEICPTGRIVGIATHRLGPVHAVRQIEHMLDSEAPVLVSYCDFTCYWDWLHFKQFVHTAACDGAIPAYRGFHPHSLGTTRYAYVREAQGWVLDVQEKQPYTNNPMREFASSGAYYFATARIMSDALRAVVQQDLNVGGEFYVSLAYKSMLAQNRPIAIYDLQHFMQWGTPEDVADYNYWSNAFRHLISRRTDPPATDDSIIVPMAGLGQRFADAGYELAKPMIAVSGKPMVAQAVHDLPAARKHVFVLRSGMRGHECISDELKTLYPGAIVNAIDYVTPGQACTALVGLSAMERACGESAGAIIISACDNGAVYDPVAYRRLFGNPDTDVIVWGVRGYPNAIRRPSMFGWIDADGDVIRSISVKQAPGNPESDPIVLGTFVFRRAGDFRRAVHRLIERDGRVNGEFYIDSCINDAIELGLNCRLFEVDSYLCWGTPDDLRTFEYWQSCFHKWASHPYRLELDARVALGQAAHLAGRYQAVVPELPSRRS